MTDYDRLLKKFGYDPVPTPEEFLVEVEEEEDKIRLQQLELKEKFDDLLIEFSKYCESFK